MSQLVSHAGVHLVWSLSPCPWPPSHTAGAAPGPGGQGRGRVTCHLTGRLSSRGPPASQRANRRNKSVLANLLQVALQDRCDNTRSGTNGGGWLMFWFFGVSQIQWQIRVTWGALKKSHCMVYTEVSQFNRFQWDSNIVIVYKLFR